MDQTTQWINSRVDKVTVQGSTYRVVSAVCVNGILKGIRQILRIDGNLPSAYSPEEVAAIYERIL